MNRRWYELKNTIRNRKGDSTIVATVLLMAITLFCMSLTLNFVQTSLARHDGENEFTLAQTFMKNIGLSVDDVAWHPGQSNTIQYSSKSAEINLRPGLIHYKIEVWRVGDHAYSPLKEFDTSVLFYDLPLTRYSLDNTYFENILPSSMTQLVQNSTEAPIARVFAVQRPPIVGENAYIKVGVASLLRSVQFNINANGVKTSYLKVYLANMTLGPLTTANPRYITLTGKNVDASVYNNILHLRITISFPKSANGYSQSFFSFPVTTQTIDFPASGAEVELYTGNLQVGFLE